MLLADGRFTNRSEKHYRTVSHALFKIRDIWYLYWNIQQIINMIGLKLNSYVEHLLRTELVAASITLDDWTSVQTETFMAVTCHFVDTKWQLNSIVLACLNRKGNIDNTFIITDWYKVLFIGSHSAHATLISLRDVLEKWKISNSVKFLLRDGENNMSAMAELSGYADFTCIAHTLHLVVSKIEYYAAFLPPYLFQLTHLNAVKKSLT